MFATRAVRVMVAPAAVAFALFFTVGCGHLSERSQSRLRGTRLAKEVDPVQLRLGLEQVMDQSMAAIVGTASEIAARTEDRRVRENTLRWKIAANDAFQDALLESDARLAFVRGWITAVQLRMNMTEGPARESFGENQELAVQTMKEVEASFVELGKQSFSEQTIVDAADDVETLGGGLSAAAFAGRLSSPRTPGNDIVEILRIPLVPVKALGAVGDTPSAINRFTEATRGTGAIVQQLPEKTRWQMELLLLEMGTTGAVARMLEEVQALRNTVEQSVASVKHLPKEARREFEASLGAIRDAEPQLSGMLRDAREVIAELNTSIAEANAAVDRTRNTLDNLDKPTDQVATVAQAWQDSIREARELVQDWDAYTSKSTARDTGDRAPTTVGDYTRMAIEMRLATEQVRGLLADLDQPAGESSSVRELSSVLNSAIEKIFWRAVILLAIALLAAVLLLIVSRGLRTQKA